MPTYEYVCKSCGEHLEVVQSFKDAALTTCPSCGGDLRKVFGNVGIVFKGSGFYKTDNRSSSGTSAGHAKTASDSSPSSGADSSGAAGTTPAKADAGSSGSKATSDPKGSSGSKGSSAPATTAASS